MALFIYVGFNPENSGVGKIKINKRVILFIKLLIIDPGFQIKNVL